jgi:hypothetical protein
MPHPASEEDVVEPKLRMTSLDGDDDDDAALLSEFLSRAQAKRAANAAMGESKAVDMSSPVVRRVLEELDVNSPSIPKATPKAGSPGGEEISSPTIARRSTRTKPRAQTRPAVPNQIPVRRANGTEFVFLQRTAAQELALATRKNTRRNKGHSVLPKYVLQALNKQDKDELFLPSEDSDAAQPQPQPQTQTQSQSRKAPRQVLWRDDQLVEYAPQKTLESPSPGTKSRGKAKTDALPATPSKKVRRINMAETSTRSVSNNPFATPVGTPVPKRRLAPRRAAATAAATTPAASTTPPKTAPTAAAKKTSGIPRKSTPVVRAKRVFS